MPNNASNSECLKVQGALIVDRQLVVENSWRHLATEEEVPELEEALEHIPDGELSCTEPVVMVNGQFTITCVAESIQLFTCGVGYPLV